MPLTLSQMAANEATVSFPYAGETVTITYHPESITDATNAALNSGDIEQVNAMLCQLIVSWDVLENDGVTMFPLDPARFGELGIPFRLAVTRAIMGNIRPN